MLEVTGIGIVIAAQKSWSMAEREGTIKMVYSCFPALGQIRLNTRPGPFCAFSRKRPSLWAHQVEQGREVDVD